MDLWGGLVYPDLTIVMMDLLDGTDGAPARPSRPADFDAATELLVVANGGGQEDDAGDTFNGIIRLECYAPTYPDASNLAQMCEVKIESCPATEIGPSKWLVDSADLWTGPIEQPDDYPDDRRITTYYRVGVRRQVRPS